MKAYRRSRCIAPLILNLGITWRLKVSSKIRPLYHWGKKYRYPWNTRMVWTVCRKEISLVPSGIRNPGCRRTPRHDYQVLRTQYTLYIINLIIQIMRAILSRDHKEADTCWKVTSPPAISSTVCRHKTHIIHLTFHNSIMSTHTQTIRHIARSSTELNDLVT